MGSTPTTASVTSSGLFAGDDPMKHSLLLLIVQIVVILCFSRLMSFIFRPLRQPRVVAEIIAGILLGPTAFGHIPGFSDVVFPKSSIYVLQTIATFGLIFFLFLVGLELDLGVLIKTGSQAMGVAVVGIVVPFALGIPVSLEIFEATEMKHNGEHFGLPFILFIGVALSITAFPVLARVLAERKILMTEIGKIAVSAAAINDVAAWALLALAVAVTNSGTSPLVILWIFLSGLLYLGIMFVIVRPFVLTLAKKDPVPEAAIAIIFLLLLLSSLATDAIGINVIFGAFIMGFIIPKDQPISGMLVEKTEDYVSILLLPLYFACSGLNVELDSISNGQAVGAFLLVTATAVVGKVAGTLIVAKFLGMSLRNSVALGFLMSTKGLVELVVLNIGLSKGVINKEIYAIMVLMALVTTIATTPMIMWLYKPARDVPPYKRRSLEAKRGDNDKLRMLVCLYGMRNVPSMINLIEMSKGRRSKRLQVNGLHLLEFSERLGAVKMAQVLKSTDPENDETYPQDDDAPVYGDGVATSLRTFGQVNNVQIKVSQSMSTVSGMHQDICSAAVKGRANIIILPYHKYCLPDGTLQSAGTGLLHVNQRVLKESPCSVAILVDLGLGAPTASPPVEQLPQHHILVLFFGGPDDREALLLAKRMAEHGRVKVTVVQCIIKDAQLPLLTLGNLSNSSKETGPKAYYQESKNWLMKWVRRTSVRWFRKQERHPDEVYKESQTPRTLQDKVSTDGSQKNSSGPAPSNKQSITATDRTKQPTNRHCGVPHIQSHEDEIQVAVGELEQENEEKLDANILGHFLTAAANLSGRITVKALEMDALEEFLGAGEYSLIIVGLHSSRAGGMQSTLQRMGGFRFGTTDHGLGSIGNWLMSKKLLSIRSSLLVVWQHDQSCNESLGGEMSKFKILEDEVEQTAVDFEEELTQQDIAKCTLEVLSKTRSL